MKEDIFKKCHEIPVEVLIIDDDPDIVSLLQDTLYMEKDFVATAVTDPLEAIELVRNKEFDLVITDLNMPNADGLTVTCAIKEIRPEVLVVIITGYATLESAIEAIRLGVYDYLPKPFSITELTFVLEKAAKQICIGRENRLLRERIAFLEGEIGKLK